MKKRLLFGAVLFASLQVSAQVQSLGTPISWKEKVGVTKKTITLTGVNNQEEATNEINRRANAFEKNMRFGKELEVSINFMQEAEQKTLPNGSVVRQLSIASENALSINLIFSKFKLSPNATLYLFDGDKTEFIGAHTSLNNNVNNMMGTELIHDDKIVIELTEPANEAGMSELIVGTVVHGYLDLEAEIKALNDSGDCMYDVNCPIGAGWENQRNSVAMMMNGGGFCTGSLVNNTSGTIIPYFLSANHCGTSPGGWVFRFRWESPAAQADCATAANSVNGPTTMNINGGILRANYSPSDFTLTELNSTPPAAWGIYYNGWNRSDIPATSAVGIHHPSGDIKKISFENQALISTTFGSSPANSHWGVTQWDNGVTEGGSSGSPLFDENKRVVGQLHGGASACGNSPNALSDEYGKFFTSWTGGGANNNRLSNWLDPSNTGATTIDGVDPAGPQTPLDAAIAGASTLTGAICSTSVTPDITISNSGSTVLTSAVINYGYDGSTASIYNWTGSLAQYQTATITLPTQVLTGGAHTFTAIVSNPNGNTDGNAGNNTINASFSIIANPEFADLSIALDCFGSEITWAIMDQADAVTFYTGGPYTDNNNGQTISGSYCLSAGCYHFKIMDEYGDGLTSQGCQVTGSVTISNGSTVVGQITQANANFGFDEIVNFCLTSTAGIDNLLNEKWTLYPNPTENNLTILLGEIEGQKDVTITSASGQLLQAFSTLDMQTELHVNGLAKGVYFATLQTTIGSTTKTFIVK